MPMIGKAMCEHARGKSSNIHQWAKKPVGKTHN